MTTDPYFCIATVALRLFGVLAPVRYPRYTGNGARDREIGAIACSELKLAAQNSKGFYPGYANTITDADSKKRYVEMLTLSNDSGSYKLPREKWEDNVCGQQLHMHICMFLILFPSPYGIAKQ